MSKIDPFWQKVIMTVMGAGLVLLGHKFPDLAAELGALGGGAVGGAWLKRPGDTKDTP